MNIKKSAIAISTSLIGLGSLAGGLLPQASASNFLYQGKCGFLVSSNFQEKCNALFTKTMLTIMPKGSKQIRIWPQQISYVSLATKKSLKMNEDLVLWKKAAGKTGILWWRRDRIPQWVIDVTAKEQEDHQFSIGFVDKYKKPQIVLFVLNDKEQASGMIGMLESYSGLSLGQSRTPGSYLGPTLTRNLSREATRKARRLAGLCSQDMFDDAEPIALELDSYIENIIDEVSIFSGTEKFTYKLRKTYDEAISYCDDQILRAHREREAERNEIAEEKRAEAREAFDMLAEF